MLRREVRVGGSVGGGCVHQRTSQTLTRDGAATLNASPPDRLTDGTEERSDLLTAAGETLGGCEMTWHEVSSFCFCLVVSLCFVCAISG